MMSGAEIMARMIEAIPETDQQSIIRLLEKRMTCPNEHSTVHIAQVVVRVMNAAIPEVERVVACFDEYDHVIDPVITECAFCTTCGATWVYPQKLPVSIQVKAWPKDKEFIIRDGQFYPDRLICECGSDYFRVHKSVHHGHVFLSESDIEVSDDGDDYVEPGVLYCNKCHVAWIESTLPLSVVI